MTITDEMIEAGARALCNRGYDSDFWATRDSTQRAPFLKDALAALTPVAPLIARQARTETVEECARIADEHAKQNRDQARKARSRMTKANRIGGPFEHGAVAEMGMDLILFAIEAAAIATAIREAGKDRP